MKPIVLRPLIDELMTTPMATAAAAEIFVLDASLRIVLRGTAPHDLVPVARVDEALPEALGTAIGPVVDHHDFAAAPIAHVSVDGVAIRVLRLLGTTAAYYAVMTLSPAR